MNGLNSKPDGKPALREQCYVCMMALTDAPPPTEPRRAEIHAKHLDFLLDLERRSILFAAGPFIDENGVRQGGGMLIIRAKTRAEAEQIAGAEPYTMAGMRAMTVLPWQRNEGTLQLRIRFADGVAEIDNRTYALTIPG